MRLPRLTIRQQLLGAFSVDLVLMMLLGGLALANMSLMARKADQVQRYSIPSMQNVGKIHDQVERYRTLQLEFMVHRNRADRDRLEHLMGQVEASLGADLREQRRLVADDSLRIQALQDVGDALDAFETLWTTYVAANHGQFLPAIRRSNTGSVQPAWSRLNPLFDELLDAVERLSQIDEESTRDAMAVVSETHRSSRLFILGDTALSLLISASVGLILAATLGRRIRRLRHATRRVADGDLDQSVPVFGVDELSQLADHFNNMVASLRHQRQALEERAAELQDSLEEQRRLTEDLVKRKQAEAAAARAKAEAEARDSAKSAFLASMSHELRTPLNAILGFAQLMRFDAAQRGDAGQLNDLGRIEAAGKHLLTVINTVLDFSKIEQGKMDVEKLHFRVDDLVQEVVGIVEPLAAERRNRLVLETPDAPFGSMHSDPGKLRQILFNLLSNAVKFTEDGTVTVGVTPVAKGYRFDIADTGIGIEPHHLEIIFEPFQQAESSTTRRFGGTGLGLVVSRQLSQLLGGDLRVISEPGRGSTFAVELPAQAPTEADGRGGVDGVAA
ncbi:MAG: ATP-binding protein [Acidobacteriota bacterium]